jgi:hypothetical protein
MYQCSKSIICSLIFGIALHASADVEMRPETKNNSGPYRPWSQEYRQFEPEHLHGMTAEKLAKTSLDDPLLRYAYIQVFLQNVGGLDNLEPEQSVVLADMRRRGEAITPLLLELARQNQETIYEVALLDRIDQVGTINLDPYLEYARNLLRERTQTMNYSLAEWASGLLSRHGSQEDVKLLERVLEERPYVTLGVSESLKIFKNRLNRPKQVTRPILSNGLSASEAATDSAAAEAKKQSASNRKGNISSRSWMIWVLFGIIISSILIWRWKSHYKVTDI